MSEQLHYLDEKGQPQGPASPEEIQILAHEARRAGRPLLVAKPGDTNWVPYPGTEVPAATQQQPVSLTAQAQRIGAAPAGAGAGVVRQGAVPAQAAQAAFARQQQAAAQAQAAQHSPAAHFSAQHSPAAHSPAQTAQIVVVRSTPWVAVICYIMVAIALLGFLTTLVLFIVGLVQGTGALKNFAGGIAPFLLPVTLVLAAFFAWAAKVVSLLNEIAGDSANG